jgi:hypothetical protein
MHVLVNASTGKLNTYFSGFDCLQKNPENFHSPFFNITNYKPIPELFLSSLINYLLFSETGSDYIRKKIIYLKLYFRIRAALFSGLKKKFIFQKNFIHEFRETPIHLWTDQLISRRITTNDYQS